MCSKEMLLFNTVIESDDFGMISKLIPLNEHAAEVSGTVFYNGIITPGIVSVSKRFSSKTKEDLSKNYNINFIDKILAGEIVTYENSPLIFDFKTENPKNVSQIIRENLEYFRKISIFDLIKAMVFYPAEVLGINNEIKSGNTTKLLLWPSPESLEVERDYIYNLIQI
jgi:hypothetical protein